MMEVKRYVFAGIRNQMEEFEKGPYVLYTDFEKVKRERDQAVSVGKELADALQSAANDNYNDTWQRLVDRANPIFASIEQANKGE